MSGIAGIVNLDGAPVDRELLLRMTQYLAPRGPDRQEIWIDGQVGFGHTLLRTTAESATERQPLTLDGKTWIVADCRVDAREELVRELVERDSTPRSDAPDPELILHAYTVWREASVDHLIGDFSFAIWDADRRVLFCARDHFGVKPFLYARAGGALIFSNDLACLRLHPAVSDDLDEMAIADFLVYGYALDADRSSFSAIRRLPAAHALTLSGDRASLRRYWELPVEEEIRYPRRCDYIDRFLELLDVATRDRLRTNTVGVFMSGGLDSTTIAATAHRILSGVGSSFDLRAHTVVFDRIVPDEERKYSQLAADRIGIPIHHYPSDDDCYPPSEPEPDWYPPEPKFLFDRGRAIAVHRPPAATSRVLLRADGADPLIEAPASAFEKRLQAGRYGRFVSDVAWLLWTRRQVPRLGIRTLIRKAFARATPVSGQPYPDWLASSLERRLDLRRRWHAENTTADIRPGFELAHSYWPMTLESLDLGSMRLAAEIRFPFLDLRLARYLLRLPGIPWGVEKSLLRVAMKGLLPREILRRPKAPLAGNPWAALVPPADSAWWEQALVPAPGMPEFVDVKAVRATLASVLRRVHDRNEHNDIDILRLSLRPISLNLWLRQNARAAFRLAHPVLQEANR